MKLYLCVSDQSPTLNMAVVGFMGRSPSLHSVNRVTHPLSIRPLHISFRSDLPPFKFSSIIKVRLLSIVQIKMCLGARRIRFNNHLGINRPNIGDKNLSWDVLTNYMHILTFGTANAGAMGKSMGATAASAKAMKSKNEKNITHQTSCVNCEKFLYTQFSNEQKSNQNKKSRRMPYKLTSCWGICHSKTSNRVFNPFLLFLF